MKKEVMKMKKDRLKMVYFALVIGWVGILLFPAVADAKVLPVYKVTNPGELTILNTKCERVIEFNEALAEKMNDLDDTLADQESGAGIAANQVGYLFRAVVLFPEVKGELIYQGDSAPDPEKDPREKGKPLELINPEIVSASGEQLGYEGCFSISSLALTIRPRTIKVKAYDRNGLEFTFEVKEQPVTADINECALFLFAAKLISHECEHLDGILCTDRAIETGIDPNASQDLLRELY